MPSLPKPNSASANDISGPRNPELIARRNQQKAPKDSESYQLAFGGGGTNKTAFHMAAQKQQLKERRMHMMQQESQLDVSRHGNAKASQDVVEYHLTPEPAKTNALLAHSAAHSAPFKATPTELAHEANVKNGGMNWLHAMPLALPTPGKRLFSQAKTHTSSNATPKLPTESLMSKSVTYSKPKISTYVRDAMLAASPQLHPASNFLQQASKGDTSTHHQRNTIPPESFYHANSNQSWVSPSDPRNNAVSPQLSRSSLATGTFTPDPTSLQRTTRSQAISAKQCSGTASAPGDQSVVIIESDDDSTELQSPKYTSPRTNSEKKCLLDRMIPQNVVKSFRSTCGKEWLFAYPVKDCRGVLSTERPFDTESGDHHSILPYSKGAAVAYLFFTRNGEVVIVPEDGQREHSLPPRRPEKFALSDCASVITTLNTEEKTDSKNEFQLIFSLKPDASFTPHFGLDSKSPSDEQQAEEDDGVVLVDDATSVDHRKRATVVFDDSSTLGDTLCLQDPDSSIINVDDAKSFSSVGFKLQNPVFVDSRPSLKESEFSHNVKRFNEFIWNHVQSQSAGQTGRVINATSAFTHVIIGIPRGKPSNIVEDPTELLDYQVPEPEKSCTAAIDPSGAPPSRPKKISIVHRVISVGDFARLDKGECLSDATIDFYSSWLRQNHPDKCRGIYFASSFFFKKLWSQQKDSKGQTDFSYMHKWNSIDIFTFEKVMFPVNLNYHWSLIVLENPAALLSQKGRCRLLYLDSLLTWDLQISLLFTQWICWMHKRQTDPQGELKQLRIGSLSLEGKKQVYSHL
jgi:hypothetical protein